VEPAQQQQQHRAASMVESHTETFVELPSDPGLQKVVCPPEHFVSVAAPDLSRTLASE
jgi:hypothetical protein